MKSFDVFLPLVPESLFYDFHAIYIFTVYLFLKYKLVSYFKISLLLIPSIISIYPAPCVSSVNVETSLSNLLKPSHKCKTRTYTRVLVKL